MSNTGKFSIYVFHSGTRNELPSTEDEFEKALRARSDLLAGIAFEQRLDLALENYFALEHCLIEMALRNAIFLGEQDDRLRHARHSVNRHLANFMSSARLYVDQTTHALSELFGEVSVEKAKFIDKSREEYDAALGYRAFQALRNYVQHRGLPTHSITFSSETDKAGPGVKHRSTVLTGLSPERLREDGKFKAQVLAELDAVKNDKGLVDLLTLAREYAGCLGRLHDTARELVKERFEKADKVFSDITDRVENQFGTRRALIIATKIPASGLQVTETVDEELIQDREQYERKNRYASHVSTQYVRSV